MSDKIQVKVVNKSRYELPTYKTEGSAGLDLRANLNEPIVLKPLERKLIPTGLFMEIPEGYEGQVRARSGLALKNGIALVNGIGTIDSDYRGEIGIIIINLGQEDFKISDGDRIAQIVFSKHEKAELIQVKEVEDTDRSSGGFGSTGVK